MRLAMITTFPPSQYPASSFGYYAAHRFLKSDDICELIVLADTVPEEVTRHSTDDRLTIRRSWSYNSYLTPARLVRAVMTHKPDVVWLNLQYTLFGTKLAPAFIGLLVPACLKWLGYPLVILLHNYLGAVNLDDLDISVPFPLEIGMKWADGVVMKSLTMADKVFVMVRDYQHDLSSRYPKADIEFVEQDLFPVPPYHAIDTHQANLMTLGYYGTYKKLEVLFEAFEVVRQSYPHARLKVAGISHPQAPNYLDDVAFRYRNSLEGVEFAGYVEEGDLPELFWDSNIVVVTNNTNTGSSGVLRYAAAYGRGVVVPNVDLFQGLRTDNWGILHYEPRNAESLTNVLLDMLGDPNMQVKMGLANHDKAMRAENQFAKAHLQAFEELAVINDRSECA